MSVYNLRPYIGVSPLVGGYIQPPYNNGAIQRNFTTLDSTFGMYYSIPIYTMSAGDTVEFIYLAPLAITSGTNEIIGGDITGANDARFNMLGAGTFADAGFNNTFLLDGVSTSTSAIYPTDGKLHSVKLTSNSTLAITTLGARQNNTGYYDGILYDVIIRNSSNVIQREYRINETWAGPSTTLIDHSGNNQHGTAVNIDTDDSENFTFNGNVSPNTWTNDGATKVIEIAGT